MNGRFSNELNPKVSLHLSMIVLVLAGLAVGPIFSIAKATNEGSYTYGKVV